ncbi:MAG TPA: (2Fe-2S)-binding protein [Pseudonocardiaceae bacterium]
MPAATPAEVALALRRAASAGPFFAADLPPLLPEDGWHPAPALRMPSPALAAAIAEVGRVTAAPRPRVAASLFTMSLTGRLMSVAVGAVLLGGVLVDLRGAEWRYLPGTGVRLRLPVLDGRGGPVAGLWPLLGEQLLDDHLAAVFAAVREIAPVSGRLLLGNAASSALGALQSLAATGVPLARCRAAASALLELPALRDTGTLTGPGLGFRRRSCCLFYLLPGSGKCADCALLR